MIWERSEIARRSGIPGSPPRTVRIEKVTIGSYRIDRNVPTVLSLPIRIQFRDSSKDKFISATFVSHCSVHVHDDSKRGMDTRMQRDIPRGQPPPFEIRTSSLQFRKHRGSIPPFQRHSLASEFQLSVSVAGDTWEFYKRIQRGHPAPREVTVAPNTRLSNNTP